MSLPREGKARTWVEAGAMVRGSIRRELLKQGLEFHEDKSLLSSMFVVYGTNAEIEVVHNWFKQISAKTEGAAK